jgi:hypothetical protein
MDFLFCWYVPDIAILYEEVSLYGIVAKGRFQFFSFLNPKEFAEIFLKYFSNCSGRDVWRFVL